MSTIFGKATANLYQFIDSKTGAVLDDVAEDRESARAFKRELKEQGRDVKIIQYKAFKVVR